MIPGAGIIRALGWCCTATPPRVAYPFPLQEAAVIIRVSIQQRYEVYRVETLEVVSLIATTFEAVFNAIGSHG